MATLRGIYTRSLGGVSLDESYRLEPTQLAGFPQAFRSLISESVVGSQSAPTFETLGTALDLKLASRTYAGIQVERLRSVVDQGLGDFSTPFGGFSSTVSSTDEQLHYTERTFGVSLNQLLGDNVVVGGAYKLTDSDLGYVFPSVHVLDQNREGPAWRKWTATRCWIFPQVSLPAPRSIKYGQIRYRLQPGRTEGQYRPGKQFCRVALLPSA